MLARLGVIVAFTVLFAAALMLVTQAKRVEVFAATSAYVILRLFSHTLSLLAPFLFLFFVFPERERACGSRRMSRNRGNF
jgi:hypothetical protein